MSDHKRPKCAHCGAPTEGLRFCNVICEKDNRIAELEAELSDFEGHYSELDCAFHAKCAENKRLREALENIAGCTVRHTSVELLVDIARQALGGAETEEVTR